MTPYALIVPTFNGGDRWVSTARSISEQEPRPQRVLVVDSSSSDGSADVAHGHGFEVVSIPQAEFDHGGTRQAAVEALADYPFVVLMTQDAILLEKHSIARLLRAFENTEVTAAYGRQMAPPSASHYEQHARAFNYPTEPCVKSMDSREEMGLKAAFCSNSFAAYRREALLEVGGFPFPAIFAEDMHLAGRLLMAGYRIAYVPEAKCQHWHDYTVMQEFRRGFDIGVFHTRERWLLDTFGRASGEGRGYVISGLKYVMSNKIAELPSAFAKYSAKTLGYALGRAESKLPRLFRRWCSMNRGFWDRTPGDHYSGQVAQSGMDGE